MTASLREPASVDAPSTNGAGLAFTHYRVAIHGYTTYERPSLDACWDLVERFAGVRCEIDVVREGSNRWERLFNISGRVWNRDREGYPPEWFAEMTAPVTGFNNFGL